jgi:uncharacterized protein (TIGR02147 family)
MFQNTLVEFKNSCLNHCMIFEVDSVQTFLRQEFRRRVTNNPRYSQRAFARNLGLSPGALSEIMHDQRPLSLKTAMKIAKSLGFNAVETKRLYELTDVEKRKSLIEKTTSLEADRFSLKHLDEDTFYLVSEWYHFAILNLVECDDFRWSATYISKRLGLTQAQAQMAMELLLRLNLVRRKGQSVESTQDYLLSPSGIPSEAIRKYHRQMLEKAIQALDLQNVEQRDISGVGFAFNPKQLPQIKKEISDFQDQLATKYSKGKRQEVYFLEMALFKLTQGEHDEKK